MILGGDGHFLRPKILMSEKFWSAIFDRIKYSGALSSINLPIEGALPFKKFPAY